MGIYTGKKDIREKMLFMTFMTRVKGPFRFMYFVTIKILCTTSGLYVFETPYGHTVVGPTNVRQDSRTDRTVGPASRQQLLEHCHALLPASRAWPPLGLYAGLRPATQHQARHQPFSTYIVHRIFALK